MKRWGFSLLLAPALWACGNAAGPLGGGAVPGAPALSAGELLAAPTKLALGGVRLSAEATPHLSGSSFVVPVKVLASSSKQGGLKLSAFKVTGVYVITEGGVWRSGVAAQDNRRCLSAVNCLQAVGRGSAELSSRDAVQVVLTLRDAAGKNYKLRDDKAVVSRGP